MDDFLNCETQDSSIITLASLSQVVPHPHNLRSRPIQTSSSSCTRSTSRSISPILRQHAQPNSSTPENLLFSIFDVPLPLRRSSDIQTLFTVHSYPKSSHLVADQESLSSLLFSSLSATNTADLPYHTLEENSKPPSPDPYHYQLKLANQIITHPRQDLRYYIVPVNRTNNSLQNSNKTRNRELTRLTD